MQPLLNIAINAARSAGRIINRYSDRIDTLNISSKGYNDFVSEVDRQAEQEIVNIIHKAYPNHGILAEEGNNFEGDEYLWIIDPLDGTTNYLHGFPQYAVSIALKHKEKIICGVIYDPVSHELFTAARGNGAFVNDRRIRVSNAKSVDNALLGTGFPFKQPEYLDTYLETFKVLHPHASGIRRAGSAALDLAYLAAGRLDGFWEIGLKPWDMAAGIVLIQEAGGLIGDFAGGNNHMISGNIIAGNPKIFKDILQKIHPVLTPELRK